MNIEYVLPDCSLETPFERGLSHRNSDIQGRGGCLRVDDGDGLGMKPRRKETSQREVLLQSFR
jgi:hypothetical protein